MSEIDLNICNLGDRLLTRAGKIVIYNDIRHQASVYKHSAFGLGPDGLPDDERWESYMDNGRRNQRIETDDDIVEIINPGLPNRAGFYWWRGESFVWEMVLVFGADFELCGHRVQSSRPSSLLTDFPPGEWVPVNPPF
jgi:hypothetical protein